MSGRELVDKNINIPKILAYSYDSEKCSPSGSMCKGVVVAGVTAVFEDSIFDSEITLSINPDWDSLKELLLFFSI